MSEKEQVVDAEAEVEVTEAEGEPTLEDVQAELERTRKALTKANREAADRRKKLDAIEAAEVQRQTDEMTELEKLRKRADEAEQAVAEAQKQARLQMLRSEVKAQAAAMNFADPTDALALLDLAALELGESGEVEGLDDALKALAKAKPYMLKAKGSSLGATNPGGESRQGGETPAERRARLLG